MKKFPVFTIFIVCCCFLSFLFHGMASLFIFDRTGILNGEIWRLLTAHLVHFTGSHLFFNLSVFVVAACIIEKENRSHLILLSIFSALIISITLLVFNPDMVYYGGLSGVAVCLIYYSAFLKIREQRWKTISSVIVVCLPVKVLLEIYSNTSVLSCLGDQPFVNMPVSHVAGLLTGIFGYYSIKKMKSQQSSIV